MQSITLCDELEMTDGERDEVICPGVEGPNLAAAGAGARSAPRPGWDGPGQRIVIRKRIPVAAGLGGGSADAAAVLRLAARRSGVAATGGSRSSSRRRSGPTSPASSSRGGCSRAAPASGIEPLPDPEPFGVLVLPSAGAAVDGGGLRARPTASAGCAAPRELEALDPLAAIGVNDLERGGPLARAVDRRGARARPARRARAARWCAGRDRP